MTYRIAAAALFALTITGCDKPKTGPMSTAEVADEISEVRMEPGEWQISTQILEASAPGMPPDVLKQMTAAKTDTRNCVTPEQAANPQGDFLAAQKDANCSYEDFSMSGGRIKGAMTCAGGTTAGKMTMRFDGRYDKTSYDMTSQIQTGGLPNDMSMTIKSRVIGKRVGECSGASKAG